MTNHHRADWHPTGLNGPGFLHRASLQLRLPSLPQTATETARALASNVAMPDDDFGLVAI